MNLEARTEPPDSRYTGMGKNTDVEPSGCGNSCSDTYKLGNFGCLGLLSSEMGSVILCTPKCCWRRTETEYENSYKDICHPVGVHCCCCSCHYHNYYFSHRGICDFTYLLPLASRASNPEFLTLSTLDICDWMILFHWRPSWAFLGI